MAALAPFAPKIAARLLVATLTISVLASTGCALRFGDPTRSVDIRNSTSQKVTVFTFDRDPRFAEPLDPGQTWRDQWMYPIDPSDSRKVRVEADASDGTRIFCAEFGYQDLARLDWKIELVAGRDDCSS